MRVLVPVATVAFTVYCLLDIALSPRDRVRTLTKLGWVVVVLLPLLGGVAWLLFGRPGTQVRPGRGGSGGAGPASGGPSRGGGPRGGGPRGPGRGPRPKGPEDDPDFLRRLGDRLRRDGDR